MNRVNELLQDLRDHWDDAYWWADHQLLAMVIITIATGTLSVGFAYLEGRAKSAGLRSIANG